MLTMNNLMHLIFLWSFMNQFLTKKKYLKNWFKKLNDFNWK